MGITKVFLFLFSWFFYSYLIEFVLQNNYLVQIWGKHRILKMVRKFHNENCFCM